MPDETLLERRHRLLGAGAPLFYDRPLHLVRGEGVRVWDGDGRVYLDAYNNVPHVGHCHPHVVAALSEQAARLNLSTRYLDARILDYGEALTATFADGLSRVALCCSGTEASELALRIARACTGNRGLIVTDFCYHGNSAAVAGFSTAFDAPEGRDPRVRTIRVPEGAAADAAEAAADVEAAIASMAEAGMKPAATLLRHHIRHRGDAGAAAGLCRTGGRAHQGRGRPLHRGRGAAGSRPHRRRDVGAPAL